jgi:copper(I)-binding protein
LALFRPPDPEGVDVNAEPVTVRRLGIGLAVVAVLLTSACAAGQHAATADELPTLDGTNATVGDMALRGLYIEAPTTVNYRAGSDPAVTLVLVNTGTKVDKLISITSAAATGWGAYASAADADAVIGAGSSPNNDLPKASTSIPVAPGTRVSWGVPDATGELLLLHTTKTIYPGTTVPLTFTFETAGKITVSVPVHLTDTPGSSTVPPPRSAGEAG